MLPPHILVNHAAHLHDQDSIISPNVLNDVTDFINEGGDPNEVVELLSENFRGTVNMSNLMVDWLLALGNEAPPPSPNQSDSALTVCTS